MKKAYKILIGIVIFIVVVVGGMAAYMLYTFNRLDNVPKVAVTDVADGTYEGIEETPLVKVTVEVTVKDHQIVDIKKIRHRNKRGGAAETMLTDKVSKNTSEVDAVSGATLSSKTIKAAVRNALAKGKK